MDLDELCRRYRQVYLPAVADALYELGCQEGLLPSSLRPLLPTKTMVGEAFTITGKDIVPPLGWDEGRLRVRKYLEILSTVTPDCVLVHTNEGSSIVGNFGELSANAVQQRGCAGVVLPGNLRDSAGMREIDFQIFYQDLSPLNGIGRWEVVSCQTPVTVGSVAISPGDIIFGDFDGIIAIPRSKAEAVLLKAEAIVASEELVRVDMRAGVGPLDSFQRHGHF